MGCILNNDGLDAGVMELFSTRGIHGAFTIVGDGLRGNVKVKVKGFKHRGHGWTRGKAWVWGREDGLRGNVKAKVKGFKHRGHVGTQGKAWV